MRVILSVTWFLVAIISLIEVAVIAWLQREMGMVVEIAPIIGMGVMVVLSTMWLHHEVTRRNDDTVQ